MNLRVEHVRISKCRTDFIRRVQENASKKKEAKEKGEKINVKRLPEAPREARHIKVSDVNAVQTLTPLPYDTVGDQRAFIRRIMLNFIFRFTVYLSIALCSRLLLPGLRCTIANGKLQSSVEGSALHTDH